MFSAFRLAAGRRFAHRCLCVHALVWGFGDRPHSARASVVPGSVAVAADRACTRASTNVRWHELRLRRSRRPEQVSTQIRVRVHSPTHSARVPCRPGLTLILVAGSTTSRHGRIRIGACRPFAPLCGGLPCAEVATSEQGESHTSEGCLSRCVPERPPLIASQGGRHHDSDVPAPRGRSRSCFVRVASCSNPPRAHWAERHTHTHMRALGPMPTQPMEFPFVDCGRSRHPVLCPRYVRERAWRRAGMAMKELEDGCLPGRHSCSTWWAGLAWSF